ncbi:hypothetical protein MMC07_006298 [Pseudocyphellaria aurata]|nr:hypothetical protein [Pseudocyphellaria aurata]
MYKPDEKESSSSYFYEIDFTPTERPDIRNSQQLRPMDFSSAVRESRIYWISPALMLLTYLIGLAAAAGQHCFYSSLVGHYVGNIDQQQRVLRYGTTFAFATQVGLVSSVGIAYTQCLWSALRRANLSIRGLDAAFGAYNTLLSFFNVEMLANVKVPSLIALLAWCLPIASLITPATLSVGLDIRDRAVMTDVFSLNISDPNQAHRYSYTVPSHDSSRPEDQLFLRPRTVIARLTVAAATTGQARETESFSQIFVDRFFGPVVKCKDASANVAKQIHDATERSKMAVDKSVKEIQNSYFAFVPDLSRSGIDANAGVIQVANHSDTNGAAHGSNELWLRFQRYQADPHGPAVLRSHSLQCQLYNTSYQVNFSFVQGVQSIQWKELVPLNIIPYPDGPSSSDQSDMEMAYTAFMWTLSDQLTGSIGFYSNSTASASTGVNSFSDITTGLQETALLGSSDLQSFFDYNHNLYPSKNGTSSGKVSDQRAEDIALARNRTFDVLIEELSANITLSLLSSDLLSPPVTANVTTAEPINVYIYHPKNLLLAYGIALFLALIAVVLGACAYVSNGVSHSNSFSSIVRATRNPDLLDIDQLQASTAILLDRQAKSQKVLRLRNHGFVVLQEEKI